MGRPRGTSDHATDAEEAAFVADEKQAHTVKEFLDQGELPKYL